MNGPMYTKIESVKVRLANKIQFQSTPECALDGELPDALLIQIIVDSETEVEQDLRGRYAIPFRSASKNSFIALPDHSQRAIRWAVDMKAVCNVLDTDFGRGTHVNAEGYKKNLEDHYVKYIKKLLGQDAEGEGEGHKRFRFAPPLDDLLLAPNNTEADDGYKGMIINTDGSRRDSVTYAEDQVNDPSQTYRRDRLSYWEGW